MIELLITMIVVGIVSAIGTFSYLHALEVAQGRASETMLRAIFEAERSYGFDQATLHYGTLADLQNNRYLSGSLNSIEWSYGVALSGVGNTAYTATATRLRGPHRNRTRAITQTGTITPATWP